MSGREFRILGPLEVVDDGLPVPLGGPRTQATLAALLLAGGQVVTVDRLVDLGWGDDPPASVRGQVAIAVSKLRKVLPGAIETVGAGYRLRAVRLDARAAEEQVAAARKVAEEGLLAEASAGFRAALGMWRGPVLAGLGEVSAAAGRWEQLRLAVHEEWAEVELALGRHGGLIGELTSFVGEHPLRERSRAQLMLALHRCGRRADALEVYREGRAILAAELGIDPGRELRRAQEAILRGDVAASPATTIVEPPPPTAVPAELPPPTAGFSGRTAELASLRALLEHGHDGSMPIAAISGPGGMGKSALAARAAWEAAAAFPDGQLYADLRGSAPGVAPVRPLETLGRFLRSLGMNAADVPSEVEEAVNRYRSLTSGRRVLVVLDNAADAAQVRPLLPSGSGCAVIVTGRRVLATLDGAAHLYLPPLTDGNSRPAGR